MVVVGFLLDPCKQNVLVSINEVNSSEKVCYSVRPLFGEHMCGESEMCFK